MHRVIVIATASILVAGCAEFSLTKFEIPNLNLTPPPPTTTLEFESEPAGAEVRTSTGQTCRTPCSLAVQATELTATFTLSGYQPQTIQVKMDQPTESVDPMTGQPVPPRLSPNPVYAELVAMPPPRRPAPPPAAKPAPKQQKPKTSTQPKPPAAPASAAPATAPPSPWPAPQQR